MNSAETTPALETDACRAVHGTVRPLVVRLSDSVTIIRGDCRDVLPVECDAVVTDPPYGIGFDYGDAHQDDAASYADMMRSVVGKVQASVNGGAVFMWQAMLNADKWHAWFPAGFRLFAACKGFVQFRPVPVQFSWDPVVFWGKCKGEPSVYAKEWHVQSLAPFGAGREKVAHPCPRPVEQVVYVVIVASGEGETVCDPFMGSGTTGLACIRTGRKFIGIEKDARYFEVARARLENELRQGLLPLTHNKALSNLEH